MRGLWRLGKHNFLRFVVLKLIYRKPRTGYDIIKYFKEKTKGIICPSKGTIYPLLNKMHKQGIIKLSKQKSKNEFSLTKKGREFYKDLTKKQELIMTKLQSLNELALDLVPEQHEEFAKNIVKIKKSYLKNKKEVLRILKKTIKELEKIK